ncbi:MAG: hypothetical protein U0822_16395 [Anaerolineae bacterium]
MSIGCEEYTHAQVLAWLIYQHIIGQPVSPEDTALALECDARVARRLAQASADAVASADDAPGEATERARLSRRLVIVMRRLCAGERVTRKRVQMLTGMSPDAAVRLLDDLSRLTPVTTDQRIRRVRVTPVDGGTSFTVRRQIEVWYLVR